MLKATLVALIIAVGATAARADTRQDCEQTEDHDLRVRACSDLIAGDPKAAWAYANRGVAYLGKRDYDRAIAESTKAIELAPKDSLNVPEKRRITLLIFLDKAAAEKAYAELSKAKDFDAAASKLGFSPADTQLGLLTRPEMIDPRIGEAAFKLKRNELSRPVKGQYAVVLLRITDIEGGKEGLPGANVLRGLAYAAKGDHDRAIADYARAIEINPASVTNLNLADAYFKRGGAFRDKKDDDRAIADYTRAIEIDPRFAEAYNNRGNAYYRKSDHNRAIADLTKAIELNPRLSTAYYNRGTAYSHKGDHGRAIADFTKAIEINPQDARYYRSRGLAYDSRGDYDRAIADFTTVIRMSLLLPSAKTVNDRGLAYLHKGDYDRAIADFSTFIGMSLLLPPRGHYGDPLQPRCRLQQSRPQGRPRPRHRRLPPGIGVGPLSPGEQGRAEAARRGTASPATAAFDPSAVLSPRGRPCFLPSEQAMGGCAAQIAFSDFLRLLCV